MVNNHEEHKEQFITGHLQRFESVDRISSSYQSSNSICSSKSIYVAIFELMPLRPKHKYFICTGKTIFLHEQHVVAHSGLKLTPSSRLNMVQVESPS